MDFLKEIVKEIGDDFTQLASDIDDTETYVDTGSYIFNGLVSGSIFGGCSGNKITAIAGESSTGKTFFSLAVVKNFLDSNPGGYCLYFDTEAAVNKSLLKSRGIDLDRLVVINVVTIEQFRQKALQAVDIYLKKSEEERKPCMFVLDSLGMLSTEKEIRDALDDKQVRDMTKYQLVNYDERGLDKYYGLLELGELGGLWKNVAGRYEIDGKKVYAKAIYKDPETYFTPEVMEKLDAIAKEEFSYGS